MLGDAEVFRRLLALNWRMDYGPDWVLRESLSLFYRQRLYAPAGLVNMSERQLVTFIQTLRDATPEQATMLAKIASVFLAEVGHPLPEHPER